MINYAVIGRNFIVDWFIDGAKEFEDFNLLGVYSRTEEGAMEYANLKGAPKTYTSIDEMCNDNELDAVYIASPNLFHEEQAYILLNAGKHIFCEKPATLSENGFERIYNAAKKNNCVFMEGMVPLYMPAYAKVKELLNEIGTVRFADFVFCQYSSRYDKFKQGIYTNTFNPELGNGAFMDLGIYCVHWMLSLFGYPDDFCGKAVFLPESIDGCGNVTSVYSDKVVNISFSKINDSANYSQIQGEKGCLLIDSLSRPKKITLKMKNQEPIIYDMTSSHHEMSYEIGNFISLVKGEKADDFSEISRLALRFCDNARKMLEIDFTKNKKSDKFL